MDRGIFTFKADKLTTLNIDKRNIATLSTPQNLMRVEMIDGTVHYGFLRSSPVTGTFYVIPQPTDSIGESSVALPILNVAGISLDNPSFFKNVQGDVSLGLSYNKSSDIFRINFSNSLVYTRHKFALAQSSDGINTLSDTAAAWERFNLVLSGIYDIARWRSLVAMEYQRMIELGISSRLLTTAGMGYPVISTPKAQLVTLAGASVSREYRTDGTRSNLQWEIPLLLRLVVYKTGSNDFTVTSSTTFYKGLTIADRIRLDHRTTLGLSVYKDLKVSLEFFVNYDSRPSSEDVSNADYGTVFGLGYTF
jgi:hypothetical protein